MIIYMYMIISIDFLGHVKGSYSIGLFFVHYTSYNLAFMLDLSFLDVCRNGGNRRKSTNNKRGLCAFISYHEILDVVYRVVMFFD